MRGDSIYPAVTRQVQARTLEGFHVSSILWTREPIARLQSITGVADEKLSQRESAENNSLTKAL
jgi:hypothetical protein